MNTHFTWCRNDEQYDPITHCRCDLEILELTIDHREGEVALATVTVGKVKLPPQNQRHVYISYGGNLIFSGRLIGLPVKITNDLISLELTSEPLDAEEQLQKLGTSLKEHPFWDPAFVDSTEQDNPSEWLEARSALFSWDRVTGKLSVSDLFQGKSCVDLTGVYFADSLKVFLAETPLSRVSMTLTAEWIQYGSGEASIGEKIASAFSAGMINTLTPNALQATWPLEGQKLGKSGFYVLNSQLKEITPPKTGVLNLYPTFTPELMTWDESLHKPKLNRARRFWMKGMLVLGWEYRQKRREVVHFTLSQKTQLDGSIRPLTRTLNLSLQELELSEESSFFQTHRGRQAIEHALEVARVHLAASARCLEVELTLPYDVGHTLSLDHSVRLTDPRLPGGEVNGKVIAYQLHQDGLRSHTWVRFVASIGEEPDMPPESEYDYYAEPIYADTGNPRHYRTPTGLVYADYSHQRPTAGLNELPTSFVGDVLKEVDVVNDSERQIHILQSQQYPVRHHLKGVLEENSTSISLNLLNLKTHKEVEHVIHLQTIGSWTAPKQVNLSGDIL